MSAPEVVTRWRREYHGRFGCPDVYEKPLSAAELAVSIDGRPMVVIDPEDREQVDALVLSAWPKAVGKDTALAEPLQAALRGLAGPPRPEEPTGLGAIVEDDDGKWWARVRNDSLACAWQRVDGEMVQVTWHLVNAAKVIADGVPA